MPRPKRDLVGKDYKSKTEKQVNLPRVYKTIPKTERMVNLPKVYYSKALPSSTSSIAYLYIAFGVGLSPNINGLKFYDSGLIYYTNKIFYDETNTYAMWISPVGYWFIRTIPFNPIGPGVAFAKATVSSGDPPTGNYTGGNGYTGVVTISTI